MGASLKLSQGIIFAKRMSVIALLVMVVGSVGLDQASKIQSQESLMVWSHKDDLTQYQGRRHSLLSVGSPIAEDGGLYLAFSVNYVRNLGAAWGTLSNLPDHIRVPFFYIVTVIAAAVILVYLRQTPWHHRLARFSLTLILSGAIGNFVDRLVHGYVIDWIDVRWRIFGWRYDFPNFNVADCAITVGVSFLIFDMLVLETIRNKREKVVPVAA